jgi:DNA-binding CsgD family transcriptional regulator
MNEAAESLLMPFAGRRAEIKLADPKAAGQLYELTAAACSVPPRSPLPPPVLLPLAPGRFLSFEAVPLPSALRHFYSDMAAVLVVRMAETAVTDPHVALAERFQLSPSEARLALHIGSSRSVREAAEREGIAFETARTRLKAIYAKTGAKRQSQLALLVLQLTS